MELTGPMKRALLERAVTLAKAYAGSSNANPVNVKLVIEETYEKLKEICQRDEFSITTTHVE